MSFLSSLKTFFAPRRRIIGITDLRRALKNNEFVFYYQPEWDLKTGHVKGVEALIRWESPNGIIPPAEFIPALEQTELINEFTPFLFDQTLHDLRELYQAGFDHLFMSVNLSVVQLSDPVLLDVIRQNLDKYAIMPEKLECEITETKSMDQPDLEFQTLQRLRDNGIKLSIDDFGSGHSSFNYLKDLNAHKLKIDRDFIQSLFDKPANETIMRTIIGLGHSLNLIVLAEGVETSAQEKWLRDNGCDYGQGFWFSRPLPLTMLIPFLRTQAEQIAGLNQK